MGIRELLKLIKTPSSRSERMRFEQLGELCESPIETMFWAAAYPKLSTLGKFTPQVETCGYRLDFALLTGGSKFAIEVNGFECHSTTIQQAADALRTRVLLMNGWIVIPFAGREIYLDVGGRVQEVIKVVRARR